MTLSPHATNRCDFNLLESRLLRAGRLLILASLIFSMSALAEEGKEDANGPLSQEKGGGNLGAGVSVGDLNGVTAKQWFNDSNAVQIRMGSVSHGISPLNSFGVVASYMHHFRPVEVPDKVYSIPFYVGGGASFSYATNTTDYIDGGLVGILGLSVLVPQLPVELFFEIRPSLIYYDFEFNSPTSFSGIGFIVEGGLGAHYYF